MHFEYVLSGNKRIDHAVDARADTAQRCCRLEYEVSGSGAGELELSMERMEGSAGSDFRACRPADHDWTCHKDPVGPVRIGSGNGVVVH